MRGCINLEVEAMRTYNFTSRARHSSESGQAMLFTLLGLGIFLIGAMAFAIDLSHMWFNRQSAQTAADAACLAGAMDLMVDATNSTTGQGGFTAGTAFDCNTSQTPAPCKYATLNGFNSSIASGSTALGNNVSVDFPASVPGVTTPPATVAPNPFMRVRITTNIPTFFAGMLSGMTKQSTGASAICGISQATSPIPIVILDKVNPTTTPAKSAFTVQGTPTVTIFGGPTQSIQVNSNNAAAVTIGGTALVDLHLGGPANTGSSFGTFGGPYTPPSIPSMFNPGTTGQWLAPSTPIPDPFALLAAPGQPAAGIVTPNVASGVNGCPAPTSGPGVTVCDEYSPGYYASGICVGSSCPGPNHNYAIFDPGIYYLGGDLQVLSLSCLRTSTATGQGIGGIMFYFSGTATAQINANSGSPGKCASVFNTTSGTGSLPYGVGCAATSVLPTNLPATLTGNVLLAPCTGTYGDPYLAAGNTPPASLGQQRGMLFFQDRASVSVNPNAGGGGSYILAGNMYFHSCNASGTGTTCLAPPTAWNDILTLQGGSGSSTYVLGQIIVDNLTLQGNASIYMDLNPSSAFSILKASLYQ
jgi:hypothetical protein